VTPASNSAAGGPENCAVAIALNLADKSVRRATVWARFHLDDRTADAARRRQE